MSDTILTPEQWHELLIDVAANGLEGPEGRALTRHDAALRSRLAEAEANLARAIVLGEAAAAKADANYMERCIVEGRLAEAVELLRGVERDLLRYGQHDHDCPARNFVLVDGIPTTCDCGLNAALDTARLASARAFIEAHG